jgi:4-alpha-glucanotransferase
VERALAAMGAETVAPDSISGPVFARPGEPLPRDVAAIVLEDGREVRSGLRLPKGTPCGYHALQMRDGSARLLVTSPHRCHLPLMHAWGWAAQLYAARSASSWGIGDLADLGSLRRWSERLGARALLINPLHAPRPILPQEASPYFASSRRFRSPLYIAVEHVPGARGHRDVAMIARQARALDDTAVIDRDRVYALKMHALARLWEAFRGDRRFDAYCDAGGDDLLHYAAFCVLSDRYPEPWTSWPDQYRHPRLPDVRRLIDADRRRIDFHRWLQWLLDMQLRSAAGNGLRGDGGVAVIHDLAIGFAPEGADAWEWQDLLAPGMTVGAPPDEYLLDGQNWGLPPLNPHRLRAAGYAPLRATLRALMRSGHGVRIDHVMGLFRLWWVPRDGSAADGVYVRFPSRETLDILALESSRAGAFVVGEDLGTVESGVRAEMRRRALLSYRVAWFESRPPRTYPPHSVAAMSTHDLPTAAGVWSGADVAELQALGLPVNVRAEARLWRRLQRLTGASNGARVDEVIVRAYAELTTAPSTLTLATLDDATAARRRPNIPGATSRPNWSIPLPRSVEQLRRDQLPRRIAAALGSGR